ncbi:MAG: endonuclease/exonuclease/phosphatase family protein [Phycisphaerales bacterium JB063]
MHTRLYRPATLLPLFLTALFFAMPALGEEVTVMTYNVENMFDIYDDPYTQDEDTDIKRREEIVMIAGAIEQADADIVVFQELENEYLLEGMVSHFLADKGYRYIAAQRTNSSRGINLGVISRYPIKRLASYRYLDFSHPDAPEQTWRFARDAMHITLDVHGQDVHIFNVHLKSNSSRPGDENSKLWRTAEAIMVKSLIRDVLAGDPDAYVLLMGDCNSNYWVDPRQDRPWPATAHLRAAEPDGSHLLIDAHEALSHEDRVTIPGDGRYPPATFDYVYASPALAQRMVQGSAFILRDPALTAGSDHLPTGATFDIGE